MAELAFLDAVAGFLGASSLSPAPSLLGVAEPSAAGDLPSVILSLEGCQREGTGAGGRRATERRRGVLPLTQVIDLANPTLPDDPTFSLIDGTRTQLILPHGGLVRADGSAGTLTGADLAVAIAAGGPPVAVIVVAGPPAAGQVSAQADPGVLVFGTALPASGSITVTYNLGAWEQELIRLTGTLRVDVCATPASQTRALSDQVASRLLDDAARQAIQRLYAIHLSALSSVAVALGDPPDATRRSARFGFLYEHERNTPESSGRAIRSIPVVSDFFPE
ncbi:MAG TPA: hypothetical protein VFT22_19660 [Kofleriaceae bacterium]|nr:hypothetical protein [Kofleriaceae bacterium]